MALPMYIPGYSASRVKDCILAFKDLVIQSSVDDGGTMYVYKEQSTDSELYGETTIGHFSSIHTYTFSIPSYLTEVYLYIRHRNGGDAGGVYLYNKTTGTRPTMLNYNYGHSKHSAWAGSSTYWFYTTATGTRYLWFKTTC